MNVLFGWLLAIWAAAMTIWAVYVLAGAVRRGVRRWRAARQIVREVTAPPKRRFCVWCDDPHSIDSTLCNCPDDDSCGKSYCKRVAAVITEERTP